MSTPTPGQIYRHRKHSPEQGKWHEYEVVEIAEPSGGLSAIGTNFFLQDGCYVHTETGEEYDLIGFSNKIYSTPPVTEPHVAYRNTKDGRQWIRPLSMFIDNGRFTLISSKS